MHNDHLRPDGFPTAAFLPCPIVITPADMQLLDYLSTRSINGDDGGEWDPTSPICIGGAGIHTTTSTTGIFGGVETRTGGRMVLGANDYPYFFDPITTSSTRERTILVPCSLGLGNNDHNTFFPWSPDLNAVNDTPSTQSFLGPTSSATLGLLLDPWIPDGAKLSGMTLRFRAMHKPAAVVANMIGFGIIRQNADFSTGGGGIIGGGTISPASPADFYANGNVQTITGSLLFADGVNNIVDKSLYTYAASVTFSTGAGAQAFPVVHSIELNFTAISDMRPF